MFTDDKQLNNSVTEIMRKGVVIDSCATILATRLADKKRANETTNPIMRLIEKELFT